ncbi:unnamed protein product [Lepeophtheirus salmonis]|uniref:(salmon louse) hypothetical protein n=1 Tax=Lepeophtheirus salmonis TaxID=72036 RepID=A0A7R8CX52_LEPSM|nr:unnamed protein product [Lepeophtheirus salmonis]CAF2958294.1 unnamed protein product [Lepeophtheirus salmonis]
MVSIRSLFLLFPLTRCIFLPSCKWRGRSPPDLLSDSFGQPYGYPKSYFVLSPASSRSSKSLQRLICSPTECSAYFETICYATTVNRFASTFIFSMLLPHLI